MITCQVAKATGCREYRLCGHPASWIVLWPAPPHMPFSACDCHGAKGIGPILEQRLKEHRCDTDGSWAYHADSPYGGSSTHVENTDWVA